LENNYYLQNYYNPKDKTLVENPCILILTLDNQRDYTIGNTNLSHNPILNPTHNLNYNKYIRIASPQISQQVQERNLKQMPVNSQPNRKNINNNEIQITQSDNYEYIPSKKAVKFQESATDYEQNNNLVLNKNYNQDYYAKDEGNYNSVGNLALMAHEKKFNTTRSNYHYDNYILRNNNGNSNTINNNDLYSQPYGIALNNSNNYYNNAYQQNLRNSQSERLRMVGNNII
jgi:hypothetical protein